MAVRRVRRVIRRIDPWTVLKVSVVFNAIAGLIFVLGVWVVWSLLLQRGVPDRIVEIFEAIRITITINGELYFRIIVFLAVVGAIAMTGIMTLGAVLYNLIADLVGGIELTVLEETYNVQQQQPVVQQRVRPAVHRGTGNGNTETRAPTRQRRVKPAKPAPEPAPTPEKEAEEVAAQAKPSEDKVAADAAAPPEETSDDKTPAAAKTGTDG